MKKIFVILAVSCAAMLGAVPPDFAASYDADGNLTDEKGAAVAGKYSQSGEPELVEGKSGKALRTGANADKTQGYNIVYPGSVVNAEAGTVTMWVKPVDWDVTDKLYHVFFRAQGRKCDLIVYKVPGHVVRLAVGTAGENGKMVYEQVSENAGNWKRGEWHFVAASWEKGKLTIIIDGRKPIVRELKNLPGEFNKCGAGGLYPTKWAGDTPGATHIDELKIFKRALSAEEIAEIRSAK